ncbi:right-handed parallel beta-helix repeat-containing protein [Calycomorphotria hydatis]|uniref:Pectate lyase superfamily protein n=1 Tax=Calycomorphotria hydatis TaxID=2528027 RepID=A0A517T7A8_9PLAN|nr:glycosyl hydrolase family 28-related protein [Calycomorphotria hydatis]QDT64240.1 Pectate lyase superfamily protein [Calycomorphotria hydatis]
MKTLAYILSITLLLLTSQSLLQAEIINIQSAPYSAKGDGEADDRPAFAKALTAANPGDVILIPPGKYRVVLTGGPLRIPQGVTLLGQAGKSVLLLKSNGNESAYRSFLSPSSKVTVEGITIQRDSEFPCVLIPIPGGTEEVTFRNCEIHGNRTELPRGYCHVFQVGGGTVKGLTLSGVVIRECSYGLFQTNKATGTLEDVLVEHCRFERNYASDLEFNSPKGVMRNITVRECVFKDNQSKTPSSGFAVGFANVTDGTVQHCLIQNYGSEALHVEDRSENIHLFENTIIGGSLVQPHGVIMVINDSRKVTIERNFIDARANQNTPHLVLVTAGGSRFPNPSDVSVIGNVLVNGESTRTWYLQPGSGPEPEENVVAP